MQSYPCDQKIKEHSNIKPSLRAHDNMRVKLDYEFDLLSKAAEVLTPLKPFCQRDVQVFISSILAV